MVTKKSQKKKNLSFTKTQKAGAGSNDKASKKAKNMGSNKNKSKKDTSQSNTSNASNNQSNEKKCKYDDITCQIIKLNEQLNRNMNTIPEPESFGELVQVDENVQILPKDREKRKGAYKKMCTGERSYEPLPDDFRPYLSLPSKENLYRFGVEYFYPYFEGLTSMSQEQMMEEQKKAFGGTPSSTNRFGFGMNKKSQQQLQSSVKMQRGGKVTKKSTSLKDTLKSKRSGSQTMYKNMGYGQGNSQMMPFMGINPMLIPKMEVGKDGVPRPNFSGTLLFPTILREGLVLESHDDSIFVAPDRKETCFKKGKDLEYNLAIGKECSLDEQCKSRKCSSINIMGVSIPGKCIPIQLLNSIGEGGSCRSKEECKGSLTCANGVCKSSEVDIDTTGFGTYDRDVLDNRNSRDENFFKNPAKNLIEDNKVNVDESDSDMYKCETNKDCKKYDDKAMCVKNKCKKNYQTCNPKTQLVCSKIGDSKNMSRDKGSFIDKKKCCTSKSDICIQNPYKKLTDKMTEAEQESSGICVDLKSSLKTDYSSVSEYNLPNRIKCLKDNNCKSGFCNKKTHMCESIFLADRECDSLYPCSLSEECVDGKCYPIKDLPKGKGRSGTTCLNKDSCDGKTLCLGTGMDDREKLEIFTSLKAAPSLVPTKKISRLFADTHCASESLKSNDFPYGVCDYDIKKLKAFKQEMINMRKSIYSNFQSKTFGLTLSESKKPVKPLKASPGFRSAPADIDFNTGSKFNTALSERVNIETSSLNIKKLDTDLPKLILFNNFSYDDFDRAASFDVFDYTSQNAILYYGGKYILAKAYFQLRNPFYDDDEKQKAGFKFDIMVMFVDHLNTEMKSGVELNELSNNLRCFYTGSSTKFSNMAKYRIFEQFPKEYGITSGVQGGFDPLKENKNILLVPNLFIYEYLVFLLFGQRIVCSPYKKFNYKVPPSGLINKDKVNSRGFYQYSMGYETMRSNDVKKIKKLEINWGENLGFAGVIDIPYTTLNMASDISTKSITGFFFGTDVLGITPEIFKRVYSYWKVLVSNKSYINLELVESLNRRKFDGQSYLLRYRKESKFTTQYKSLGRDNLLERKKLLENVYKMMDSKVDAYKKGAYDKKTFKTKNSVDEFELESSQIDENKKQYLQLKNSKANRGKGSIEENQFEETDQHSLFADFFN